jgi:hypothetical protein
LLRVIASLGFIIEYGNHIQFGLGVEAVKADAVAPCRIAGDAAHGANVTVNKSPGNKPANDDSDKRSG